MSTRYTQGRDTEYMAMHQLEAEGYTATRSAGSHTQADLIAWNSHHTRFIQCKRFTDRAGNYRQEAFDLGKLPLPPQSTAELWIRRHGRPGWLIQALIKSNQYGTITYPSIDDVAELIHHAITEDRQQWKQRTVRRTPTRHPKASTSSTEK